MKVRTCLRKLHLLKTCSNKVTWYLYIERFAIHLSRTVVDREMPHLKIYSTEKDLFNEGYMVLTY